MRLFYLFVFFALLSCKNEETNSQPESNPEPGRTTITNVTESDNPVELPPRSGGCNFVGDEQILEVITGEKDGANIANSPGRTESACYYRLDAIRWSGDLVIEVADGMNASEILDAVEKADAAEQLTVAGHPAQLINGSRILRVAASPPFEIKLSILPKAGYKEFADDTDRKRMLTELADILAKR